MALTRLKEKFSFSGYQPAIPQWENEELRPINTAQKIYHCLNPATSLKYVAYLFGLTGSIGMLIDGKHHLHTYSILQSASVGCFVLSDVITKIEKHFKKCCRSTPVEA